MADIEPTDRRRALLALAGAGALVTLAGCGYEEDGEDVSATEDMMREHGVLRRILVAHREAATMLRAGMRIDARAIADAADLFRQFGEDYHERKLEEEHVFPAVKKAGGAAGALVDTLVAQHRRGREINLFLIDRCRSGSIASAGTDAVARAMESFARMYEIHAALEDTVVFQAWKKALSKHELDEASEQFEKIERQQFKGDGFDMGVDRVAEIERRLGIADLARFTAPAVGQAVTAAPGSGAS